MRTVRRVSNIFMKIVAEVSNDLVSALLYIYIGVVTAIAFVLVWPAQLLTEILRELNDKMRGAIKEK